MEKVVKEALFGKTQAQLIEIVTGLGLPKFTAGQIANWLYKNNIDSIEAMSNLSKKARLLLDEKYKTPQTVQKSIYSKLKKDLLRLLTSRMKKGKPYVFPPRLGVKCDVCFA